MSDSLLSTLAARARQERLRLGWTQIDIAARVGISRSTYVRFEQSAAVTLPQLARVLDTLGLTLLVAAKASEASPTPNPKAARLRQRGVRRPRTATAPSPPADAKQASESPSTADSKSKLGLPARQPKPDPAAIAAIATAHRDAIAMLVRVIVMSGLTNYTSNQVARNTMLAQHTLAAADWPVFLAAVEMQLDNLSSDTIATFSLGRADFDHWSRTWKRDLGFVDVLGTLIPP